MRTLGRVRARALCRTVHTCVSMQECVQCAVCVFSVMKCKGIWCVGARMRVLILPILCS
jgi:hypothetical protein